MIAATFGAVQGLELVAIGVLAGIVGGMLGVGGGIVMIPALTILLGEACYGPNSFHAYQLAAIAVSMVVSIPAVVRHTRAKAIVWSMLPPVLPLALVGVVIGAAAGKLLFSNEQTHVLRRVFGVCLELVVVATVYQNWRTACGRISIRDYCPLPTRRGLIGGVVGLPTGVIAGLLGIGGGIWNVPVQHMLFGMSLRYAVATSSCIVVFVSAAAALSQGVAVEQMHGLSVATSAWLALWLAPGAVVGGWCGAELTHRLPVAWLRNAFLLFLAASGVRLVVG